jgi:hypothetical protein
MTTKRTTPPTSELLEPTTYADRVLHEAMVRATGRG